MLRAATAAFVWAALVVPATLVATAQDATPMASPMGATSPLNVPLIDAQGKAVGLATFTEGSSGVSVKILMEGLAPGEHGWHLHDFGICDPAGGEPFESAGPHWNPTDMPHGAPDAPEHHVGDFGNFMASADGLAQAQITTSDFTLGPGPTSVFDEDGTAIIIHAGQDDLTSPPSGNSGPRFACGVVAKPTNLAAIPSAATPIPAMTGAASPMAGMQAATPVAATPMP
jgi:Cu-Zn family superoxide dismutase